MRLNIGRGFLAFCAAVLFAILPFAGTAQGQLVWKGHTWNETTGGMAGVAKGNPANITVDANGYLHLTIQKRGSTWTASEMFTADNLGFGTYQYWIQGAVDNMDKSTVLGLFPYGPEAGIGTDGENELDIEMSKWNNGGCTFNANCNADFTFYPSTGNAGVGPLEDDFVFSLSGGTLLTARLNWTPTSVTGTLMSGLQPIGTTANVLRTYTITPSNPTVAIPQVALPLGINFWAYQAVPATMQSVIIQDFQFVPQGAADFGLTATPSSQTVTAGSSASYTATISPTNGFTGNVAMTASGLPTGATASFSPSSVSGSGTTTMTITTTGSTPAGTSTISVKGTSGSLVHTANVTLVVNTAANFTLAASPSSQTVTPGTGTSYTATVGAVNGFAGAVALTASGLPTGATASFSPASLTGSGTSTMSVTTTSAVAIGAYTLTITGTSGSLVHTANVMLVVTSAGGGGGPIKFVQLNSNDNVNGPPASASTVAVAYTAAQTAGNLNVVAVGWNDITATVTSITDTKGNVYTLAVGPTKTSSSAGTITQSIYYAKNIAAAAANGNTVTVKFSTGATYPDVRVVEYSGVTTLDAKAGAWGNSANTDSGAATTTTANELLFGANTVGNGVTGPGTGYTKRIITGDGGIVEDEIVSSTGTFHATAPQSPSGLWVMQLVTFK